MSRIVAVVGFGLLSGCVHTPPHPALEGAWSKEFTRRQEIRQDGRYCAWEAESPAWAGTLLWPAEAPIGDNWCESAGETSRWFDVVGQDGAFLSTHLQEQGCCPDRATAVCVTWNLSTAKPATLVEYDEKRAERRWERAQALLQTLLQSRPALAGYTITPDAFVVKPGGHVAFCAAPPGGAGNVAAIVEINVK